MLISNSKKAFCKRFTCLLIVLVMMLCLVPDFSPKAQAFAPIIPLIGWGLAEIAAALGISTLAAGAFYVVMDSLDKGATGYQYSGTMTDAELNARMYKSNMMFGNLTYDLQQKIIAAANGLAAGVQTFDFTGADMKAIADASAAAVPFVFDTDGLYKYSGITVRDVFEGNFIWYPSTGAMFIDMPDSYTIYNADGSVFRNVNVTTLMQSAHKDFINKSSVLRGFVLENGKRYCVEAIRYVTVWDTVNVFCYSDLSLTTLFDSDVVYFVPSLTATKAANAIDWTGVDTTDKFRVRTPAYNPTLPPEQAAAEGIRAVGTMPYADVVAKTPELPDTGDIPVSNWKWWDKLQQMILGLGAAGDLYNGLRDALDSLRDMVGKDGGISKDKAGTLDVPLDKIWDYVKDGEVPPTTLVPELIEQITGVKPEPPVVTDPDVDLSWWDNLMGFLGSILAAITGLPAAIAGGFKAWFDSLLAEIAKILAGIGGLSGAIVNGFKDWLNSIVAGIATIISYLNPTSDVFFLKVAFVPEPDFIQKRFDGLKGKIFDTFGVVAYYNMMESVKNVDGNGGNFNAVAGSSNNNSVPTGGTGGFMADFDVWGVGKFREKYLDSKFFQDNKQYIFNLMRAALVMLLIVYNLNQVYKLLNRGASLTGAVFKSSDTKGGGKG